MWIHEQQKLEIYITYETNKRDTQDINVQKIQIKYSISGPVTEQSCR